MCINLVCLSVRLGQYPLGWLTVGHASISKTSAAHHSMPDARIKGTPFLELQTLLRRTGSSPGLELS